MLYPFACDACGHYEELYASMADGPPDVAGKTCPACEEGVIYRVYTTGHTFVKGTHKNSKSDDEVYERDVRTSLPRSARGLTPDQYEKAHEESFKRDAEIAAEVDRSRKLSGRASDEFRHVGSIPLAEFAARQKQAGGKVTAAQDREYWESRGRIFPHEKGRGE